MCQGPSSEAGQVLLLRVSGHTVWQGTRHRPHRMSSVTVPHVLVGAGDGEAGTVPVSKLSEVDRRTQHWMRLLGVPCLLHVFSSCVTSAFSCHPRSL